MLPTRCSLCGASPRRGAGPYRWNVFILDRTHIGRGQLHQRLRPTRGPDELYLKRRVAMDVNDRTDVTLAKAAFPDIALEHDGIEFTEDHDALPG